MTNEEIIAAAKEAGCNVSEVESGWVTYRDEPVGNMLQRFAAIVEKRTIEKCAVAANKAWFEDPCYIYTITDAIRALGEQ